MWVLPVSARLHTPGTAGLCLGERRRFGALQERCRLHSLGVLKLSDKHMHTEDCVNIWWKFMLCTETNIQAHLSSALCSLCVLPFLREDFLSSSSSYWNAALRPQAWTPTPGVTVGMKDVLNKVPGHIYIQTNIDNNINRINQIHKHLHWIARRRCRTGGLFGGVELLLRRLRLLSKEGDAWTVILCWKSETQTFTSHHYILTHRQSHNALCKSVWEMLYGNVVYLIAKSIKSSI